MKRNHFLQRQILINCQQPAQKPFSRRGLLQDDFAHAHTHIQAGANDSSHPATLYIHAHTRTHSIRIIMQQHKIELFIIVKQHSAGMAW